MQYQKDPYSNDLVIWYGRTDSEGKYLDSVTIKDYFDLKVKTSVYRIEALRNGSVDEYISKEMNFIIIRSIAEQNIMQSFQRLLLIVT